MRLIDADSLKYRRKDYGGHDDVGDEERKRGILFLLEKDIEAAPTIDPAENGGCWGCCCEKLGQVKHGKWEKDSDTAFYWRCSECGAYLFWRKEEYLLRNQDNPNYCPNCGARMDG